MNINNDTQTNVAPAGEPSSGPVTTTATQGRGLARRRPTSSGALIHWQRAAITGLLTLTIALTGMTFGAPAAHAGGTPAKVMFQNCNDWQLSQFGVIPEVGGAAMLFPRNGVWYASDGVWVRGTRASWVKMPGNWPTPSEYKVACNAGGYQVINWWPGVWPFMASWQPAGTAPAPYPWP